MKNAEGPARKRQAVIEKIAPLPISRMQRKVGECRPACNAASGRVLIFLELCSRLNGIPYATKRRLRFQREDAPKAFYPKDRLHDRVFSPYGMTASRLALVLFFSGITCGFLPISTTPDENVALSGYDTVAYFTAGHAVKGSPFYFVEWHGAIWRFHSKTNRPPR